MTIAKGKKSIVLFINKHKTIRLKLFWAYLFHSDHEIVSTGINDPLIGFLKNKSHHWSLILYSFTWLKIKNIKGTTFVILLGCTWQCHSSCCPTEPQTNSTKYHVVDGWWYQSTQHPYAAAHLVCFYKDTRQCTSPNISTHEYDI